jgi:hypothetical protein
MGAFSQVCVSTEMMRTSDVRLYPIRLRRDSGQPRPNVSVAPASMACQPPPLEAQLYIKIQMTRYSASLPVRRFLGHAPVLPQSGLAGDAPAMKVTVIPLQYPSNMTSSLGFGCNAEP